MKGINLYLTISYPKTILNNIYCYQYCWWGEGSRFMEFISTYGEPVWSI